MCRRAERHDNITPATVMPRGKLREPRRGNKKQGVLFQLHAPFALHWFPCKSRGTGKEIEKANAQPGQFISCGELGWINDTHMGTSRVLALFALGAPDPTKLPPLGDWNLPVDLIGYRITLVVSEFLPESAELVACPPA
jgi:hypothetical protein